MHSACSWRHVRRMLGCKGGGAVCWLKYGAGDDEEDEEGDRLGEDCSGDGGKKGRGGLDGVVRRCA